MQGTIHNARQAARVLVMAAALGATGAAPATIVMNGTRYVYGKR
jgi:hypothetical protein